MANQMIALQAKGPKLPDPANQTAKYANMMNMAKQQEVAERQSAQAAQQMSYATAEEDRKKQMFPSALAKGQSEAESAELDRNAKAAANLKTDLGVITSGDVNAISAWRENAAKMLPAWGQYLPPAEKIAQDRNAQLMIAMTIQQIADKTIATPTASLEVSTKGAPRSVQVGGFPGTASQSPVYDVQEPAPAPAPAPQSVPNATTPATPVPNAMAPAAAAAPPMSPSPIPNGKFGEARFAPDGGPLTPELQDSLRRMKEGLGMKDTAASFTPGSMGTPTAGQMTPDMVPAILDSAVNTGVMAQIDLDQMLALAPPQARDGIMNVIRENKIALQADAPSLVASAMGQQQPMGANPVQTPDAGFAVYRGNQPPQSRVADLGSQPMMRDTRAQSQGRTSTPLMQKNPNVSTAPAESAEQAGRRSLLGRETAGEVYAKEKARAKAQREALLEAGPKPLTAPQEAKLRANITKDYKSARSTIDMMLNPVAGVVAAVNNVRKLSPDQKEAITGYSGYLPTMYASTKSADTAVKNLKGKVTEMGKSVAALTGAIGQMAVQEWRIVSDMIASLDIEGMGAADLDNQLDIIEAQARRAVEVTRDAYENQYVEEFDRYPGRFRLPDASAAAAPADKRRTPTKGAIDRNNPLLRN